jgi:hypothetical protein
VHTWHGYLGYATYGAGALSVALGAAECWSPDVAYPWAVAAAAAAAAALAVALRLALPHPSGGGDGNAYAQVAR